MLTIFSIRNDPFDLSPPIDLIPGISLYSRGGRIPRKYGTKLDCAALVIDIPQPLNATPTARLVSYNKGAGSSSESQGSPFFCRETVSMERDSWGM